VCGWRGRGEGGGGEVNREYIFTLKFTEKHAEQQFGFENFPSSQISLPHLLHVQIPIDTILSNP